MIKAEVVAHSICGRGNELTSFLLTAPRYILAEINTHRMFSRNSASSRAIPFDKMVEAVMTNPFIPMAFQKDHKGMQGSEYVENSLAVSYRRDQWLKARDRAVESAVALHTSLSELFPTNLTGHVWEDDEPVTKQMCNRLLEPFMYHTIILTSSSAGLLNFYNLRTPRYDDITRRAGYFMSRQTYADSLGMPVDTLSDLEWLKLNKGKADIHLMTLAESMYEAHMNSSPQKLAAGEWHIPFDSSIDRGALHAFCVADETGTAKNDIKLMLAVAKCARVSYTVPGGESVSNYEKDIALFQALFENKHLSPFEHVARVCNDTEYEEGYRGDIGEHGHYFNLRGFIPYRYFLENNIKI